MSNIDLLDFINSASDQIAAEYIRIGKRAKEDPGTAGDEGEENWAALLREWLPSIFHVVTKGRIINSRGIASPQVDVLVLRPEYPKGLINKKMYLAEGVLAAFECKTTLRDRDLKRFFTNSVQIKNILPANSFGSIYETLQSPIFYGLLTHSHAWKKKEDLIDSISDKIYTNSREIIKHPREMPDCICLADAGCWMTTKYPLPSIMPNYLTHPGEFILTVYMSDRSSHENKDIKPIASFLRWLLFRLSKEHIGLWPISRYFTRSIKNFGGGLIHEWAIAQILTESQLKELRKIQRSKNYEFPSDWKFLGIGPP